VKLTIRVPATTANLGPGFDCLGLALHLWSTVTVEVVNGRLPQQPRAARLVRQGLESAYAYVGEPPRVSVTWDAGTPIARGLGGSAALRAAGLVAGNRLIEGALDDERLLELGARLEGHADNMAPALFGGLQVVVRADDHFLHVKGGLPADLSVVLFVPEFDMPTQESRRRLPKQLSQADAIFNWSRTAMLVAALSQGRYDLLDAATQDRMHQPVRGEIFPALGPIMHAAKDGGAAAAYLSGGGSTVAALVPPGEPATSERVARLMTQTSLAAGYSGRSIITRPSDKGAYLVEAS
jgi:homoserine kinase